MNYVVKAFPLAVYVQLRRWKNWLPLLMLPLFFWAVTAIFAPEENSAPVQVGICSEDTSTQAQQFVRTIREFNTSVITFVLTDEETICRNVSCGQWDCGIVLGEEFGRQIEELNTDDLFTLYISDGSVVYPLVRESIFSCLSAQMAPIIAWDYLERRDMLGPQVPEIMEAWFQNSDGRLDKIQIDLQILNQPELDPLEAISSGNTMIFQGILASLLLICSLFAAVDLGYWLERPDTKRLSCVQSVTALMVPEMLARMTPFLLFGGISVWIITGQVGQIFPLAGYVLLLGMLACSLARLPVLWRAIPVVLPLCPAFCFLLTDAFFDLSVWGSGMKRLINWFPVNLYLHSCEGEWIAAAGLWSVSGMLFILLLCMDRIGNIRFVRT